MLNRVRNQCVIAMRKKFTFSFKIRLFLFPSHYLQLSVNAHVTGGLHFSASQSVGSHNYTQLSMFKVLCKVFLEICTKQRKATSIIKTMLYSNIYKLYFIQCV